ncbi:DUF6923 family protein [Chitinophagaceae bacterium MMS25-I14]
MKSIFIHEKESVACGKKAQNCIGNIVKYVVCCLALLNVLPARAQQGYIYVHKRTLDESSSVDFNFTATGGSTTIPAFTLNDNPANLGIQDIGSSQAGRLYAVSGTTPGTNTMVYYRDINSSTWVSTTQTAVRVDGYIGNQAVICGSGGNVFTINGTTSTQIGTPSNYGNSNAVDVASGWDITRTFIVNALGEIWRYDGSWTRIYQPTGGAQNNAKRIDVNMSANSSTTAIVFATNGNEVWTMGPTGNNLVHLGSSATTGQVNDVAYDATGRIIVSTQTYQYRWTGSAWTIDASQAAYSITGGLGGQFWDAGVMLAISQTHYTGIYTRTETGEPIASNPTAPNAVHWIDDERVRASPNDNSEMIAVTPGTYTITETVPGGWALQRFEMYDPTSNSSSSVSNANATLNVAAGEVVHVIFQNGLVNNFSMTNSCSTNYVETFGSTNDAVANPFGDTLRGQTSYHLSPLSYPPDGYYKVVTTSNGSFTPTLAADHTADAAGQTGYFMEVNASFEKGEFFRRRFTGVISGATYNFSAWLVDLSPSASIRPNVLFQVVDAATGSVLASSTTGNISATTWTNFGFSFTAPSSSFDLVIQNNGIGGAGNDLGLDDITFAMIPPTTPVTTVVHTSCSALGSITVTSPVSASYEYSIDGTNFQSSPSFTNLTAGIYTTSARFAGTTGCLTSKTDTVKATICGTVFNDLNGLADGAVNGTGTNAGSTLKMVLYDSTAKKVMQVVSVASDGSYSFLADTLGHKYTLFLTTTTPTIGQAALPTITLPAGYVNAGENLGSSAGSDGTANGVLPVGIVSARVTNANFGIEQPPTALTFTGPNQQNPGGNGKLIVPALSGSDPEQGSFPGTGNADTIIIRTLPANATLYYNGVPVVAGDTIKNYNPALLTVDPTPTSGSFNISFQYSEVDAALKASANATVTIPVSDPTAFVCANGLAYQIATAAGGTPSTLYSYNVNTGVRTTVAALTIFGNAFGYNVTDNMIWGADLTNKQLVRIDATGTVTSFNLPNLPFTTFDASLGTPYNVGTVSPTGYMYLYTTGDTSFYVVDVNPARSTYLQVVDPTALYVAKTAAPYGTTVVGGGPLLIEDWVFNSTTNKLQTIIRGVVGVAHRFEIATLDPTTGVTVFSGTPVTGGGIDTSTGAFGAQFFDAINNYYIYSNVNGNFYKVNTTTNTATYLSTSPISNFNDGANCPTAVLSYLVSGHVYNDANGLNGTPSNTVDGTGTNTGTTLYAILYDNTTGQVIDTAVVDATGNYQMFGNPGNNASVYLTTTPATKLQTALPTVTPPPGWAYVGEAGNPITGAGSDAATNGTNGILAIGALNAVTTQVNFGIEQPPTANNVSGTFTNPGGTATVQVPTLNGTDPEQGSYPGIGNADTVIINTLPASGTLYYNGVAVTAGQQINNYDPTKLTYDPPAGGGTYTFTYSEVDAALKSSAPATVSMTFNTISVSGNVYDDQNGLTDNTVNGSGTNGGGLNAVLIDNATGKVAATTTVAANGTYSFAGIDGGNYSVEITTATATVGNTPPSVTLPSGYVSTGENLGLAAGSDGTANGILSLGSVSANTTNANFGMEQTPTANAVTATSQQNPGGNAAVVVPVLNGTDPEQGTFPGTGNADTVIINTLPVNGTLYYNGVAVTAGQQINDYNPALLTVNPNDGITSLSFTYSEVDAAGKVSPAAVVTMPFTTATTFTCANTMYEVAGTATSSTLSAINVNTGVTTPVASYAVQTNAIAFNPFDNLLWGLQNGNQLVRIDATGTVQNMNVANLTFTGSPAIGAISPTGYYYISTSTAFPAYYVVDLNPARSTYLQIVDRSTFAAITSAPYSFTPSYTAPYTGVGLGDWAWNPADGMLWGIAHQAVGGTPVNQARLFKMDPATGAVTVDAPVLNPNLGATSTMGSIIIDGTGYMYAKQNITGNIYKVNMTTGANSLLSTASTVGNNDGASCPTAVLSYAISGTVFNDANGLSGSPSNTVDGTGTNTGGTLYAVLYDNSTGQVIDSAVVKADGTYTLNGNPGNNATVYLTTTPVTPLTQTSVPTVTLPSGWVNTGEAGNAVTGAGSDGTPNGVIVIGVLNANLTQANYGIEQPPTANNVSGTFTNPGGTATVTVPTLNGTDPEQGTYPGTGNVDTVIINTLPASGTLYYNGVAVTAGQQINNYDPTKLTYDPPAGAGTYTFTYSEVDAALKSSTPATVSMTFNDLTISGTAYDDADGGTIDGTVTNTIGSNTLYANLVNSSGNVIASVPVAANGTYSFGTADGVVQHTNYTVVVTNGAQTIGSAPNTTLSNAANTAEGTTAAGDGNANGSTAVSVGTTSVTNVNFGIDQKPNSDNKTTTISTPASNSYLTLDGTGSNPPFFTGNDAEDQVTSGTLQHKSVQITSLPTNGTLLYNGLPVNAGDVLNGFDPSLLQIQFTGTGYMSLSFNYAFVDAANIADPTPAAYVLNWAKPLPVVLKYFAAIKGEGCSAVLNWETGTETNCAGFTAERSTDNGQTFETIGNAVAKGSGSNYVFTDNAPQEGNNLYRLRINDKDGSYSYSAVTNVKVSCAAVKQVKLWPNPATDQLMLEGVEVESKVQLYNSTGQLVRTIIAGGTIQHIQLQDMPSGIYQLHITAASGTGTTLKFIKQ